MTILSSISEAAEYKKHHELGSPNCERKYKALCLEKSGNSRTKDAVDKIGK
jgi:hypothetical protein